MATSVQNSYPITLGRLGNRRRWTRLLLSIGLLTLTGCASQRPLPPLPDTAPASFPSDRYLTGDVLDIRNGRLTLAVYRGGRLARLGHNHIITSDAVQGRVRRAENNDLSASYADLYLPLASLVVDPPEARAAAGPDFSSTPSERDRQGTLANMLGPRLLDAEQHPYLSAAVTLISSNLANVELRIRDQDSSHEVPVTITPLGDGLLIAANFSVTHDELGLTPFSAFGGAVAVADPIRVSLQLEATALR